MDLCPVCAALKAEWYIVTFWGPMPERNFLGGMFGLNVQHEGPYGTVRNKDFWGIGRRSREGRVCIVTTWGSPSDRNSMGAGYPNVTFRGFATT